MSRALRVLGGCSFASLVVFLSSVHAAPDAKILDIWSWGANDSGKLGTVPENPTVPGPLHVPKQWIQVSGGLGHSLALTANGEVWAWGSNLHGELGDGTNVASLLPKRIPTLSGITMIAAGSVHNFAYRASDGSLFAWGSNTVGQLAQPATVTSSSVPIQITAPGPVRAIAAGGSHCLVLTEDGLLYAWGGNSRGQLGLGDFQDRRAPELVPLPEKVRSVAGGGSHTAVALEPDGAVYTWGWNVFGQLGRGYDGTPTDGEAVPASASGLSDVTQVSAGDLHNLALAADGHVWVWGYNTEGQLGNGPKDPTTDHKSAPLVLTTIDHVATVDAGGIFSMALRDDGTVWAWGDCRFGACGINHRWDARDPVPVLLDRPATSISAGGSHVLVLAAPRPNTTVTIVGVDRNAPSLPAARPVVRESTAIGDVAELSSGWHHTLALDGDHKVWAWGDNEHGQLGFSGAGTDVPTLVPLPLDDAVGFSQIVARANQSFALRSDGKVFAWGDSAWGQLGTGSKSDTNVPTALTLSEQAVRVAAGERHGLVLGITGAVYSFGQNLHGELGTPPSDKLTLVPTVLPYVQNPVLIAAGGFHSLALDGGGQLTVWGAGLDGQLGGLPRGDSYRPVTAGYDARDVMSVSAGRFHTVVVRAGGTVSAFGANSECQIGSNPMLASIGPTDLPITALSAVAGDYHSLAVDAAGTVYGWGNDSGAQLGQADTLLSHWDCDPMRLPVSGGTELAPGFQHSVVAGTPPAADADASADR